jgi:hypothetical protein
MYNFKKFNRIYYHTVCFTVYGVVAATIPVAKNSTQLMIQLAVLGFCDGVFLSFIVPIAFDSASKSPILTNQAIGKCTHFFLNK